MTSLSKPIVKDDDIPSVAHEEVVRAPTPVPTGDEEDGPRDANGEFYSEYDGGLTPRESPRKTVDPTTISEEISDGVEPTMDPSEETSEENEKDKFKDDPLLMAIASREGSPVPIHSQQPVVFTNSSGPLTPQMLAAPIVERRSRKRKEDLEPSKKDRTQSNPSRQPETHDIGALHREVNLIMSNTLKENDIRQISLNMQGQISQVSGSVSNMQGTLARIQTQSQSTQGHTILLEEAVKAGIGKIEGDVRSAWISQGRNRAAIAENGLAIKELDKNVTACYGLLKEIVARLPPPIHPFGSHEPISWMHPPQQAPGPSDQRQVLPNMFPQLQQLFAQREQEPTKKVKEFKKTPLVCAYCSAKHRSYKCPVFGTWKERRKIILTEKGCLMCLAKDVDKSTHDCERRNTICSQCRMECHHSSVCDKPPKQGSTEASHDGPPAAKKAKHFPKKESTRSKPPKAND